MRFPRGRGVTRLMNFVQAKILPRLPHGRIMVRCTDGRQFDLPLHETATYELMMTGLRDPRESNLLRAIINKGDVVGDAGANCGWYTTLMAQLVGESGCVHAFEPVPPTHEALMRNCQASGVSKQARINNFALGESVSTSTIFVPKRHSAASLRPWGNQEMTEYNCSIVPLDDYCEQHGIDSIKIIKCDVEGSEMSVLQGATRLLGNDQPPMWLIEMNHLKSSLFEYDPEQLLSLLRGYGYVVHKLAWRPLGHPIPMGSLSELAHAENVLCSVPDVHGDVGRYCMA